MVEDPTHGIPSAQQVSHKVRQQFWARSFAHTLLGLSPNASITFEFCKRTHCCRAWQMRLVSRKEVNRVGKATIPLTKSPFSRCHSQASVIPGTCRCYWYSFSEFSCISPDFSDGHTNTGGHCCSFLRYSGKTSLSLFLPMFFSTKMMHEKMLRSSSMRRLWATVPKSVCSVFGVILVAGQLCRCPVSERLLRQLEPTRLRVAPRVTDNLGEREPHTHTSTEI